VGRITIRDGLAGVEERAVALNNAHAIQLSWIDDVRFSFLTRHAFYARRVGDLDAFLIALDQSVAYDSVNYAWFKSRYRQFVYVDRVAVDPAARRRGLAQALYRDLFDCALKAGHSVIVSEVNLSPPNLSSDLFHQRFGFRSVGEARIERGSKTVQYLELDLRTATETFPNAKP